MSIQIRLAKACSLSALMLTALMHPAFAADECALPKMAGHVDLEPGCTYHKPIVIKQPTELDCHGAVIDGNGQLATGILIDSDGKPLHDVAVHRCVVRNFAKTGIAVGWSLADGLKKQQLNTDDDAAYEARSPSQTIIDHTRVENIGGVGIYVDDHVVGTRLENLTVANSGGVGIYLEHDSRQTTIDTVDVENNGWKGSAAVQPGLSIDASQNNVVRRSTFRHNGLGGIFLYRNCGERVGIDPKAVPRAKGANGNLIEQNRFDEAVDVWVASRMSRNLRTMQCGRKPYFDQNGVQVVLDEARNNTLRDNVFAGSGKFGVVVEDNDNALASNEFNGSFSETPLLIGTKYRTTMLGQPVEGTQLSGNRFRPGQSPKWIYQSQH